MARENPREHTAVGAPAADRATRTSEALLELHQRASALTDEDLYHFALDHAVLLTDSEIGFFHLVSEDQQEVALTTWNRAALDNCTAVYDTHYPIDQAGNWVDCVRLKRPVVHNDYPNSPNQKGLPKGHSPVRRLVNVPVVEDDMVRAIFGVANKPVEYDDSDVVQLQLVADELLKIIQQRRTEQELRRLNRDLRALSDCNQALIRAEDEQTLLDDICRLVCEDAGYRMAWVGYAESDADRTIRPVAAAGVEDGYLKSVAITWADTEHGRGPTGTAVRTGATDCIHDVETDPRMAPWREAARRLGYRSSIALPLMGEDSRVFGALNILSADREAFAPEERRLLEELAGDLAYGITALRTRARGKEAEASFTAAFQATPDLTSITKIADGRIVEVNEGFTQVLGYSAEESIGRTTSDLSIWADPADRAAFVEALEATGRVSDFETKLRRKDGRIITVSESARALDFGGEPCILAVARDITQRKQTEDALREERGLFVAGPTVVFRWRAQEGWPVEYVSPNVIEQFGYTPEALISGEIPYASIVHPDDLERVGAEVSTYCQQGASAFEQVYRIARSDGSYRWIDNFTTIIRQSDGTITHYLGYILDITDRKQAETELLRTNAVLRETAASLNDAQRIAHLGSWELNIVDDTLVWSDQIYRMFEIDPDQFGASYEAFLESVHPDDRESVHLAYTGSLKTKTPYTIDHRLLMPDGRVKYVHEECETTYDEAGNPIRSVGTVQDVTERKRVEEAARENQQRYRDIFDHSTDSLYLLQVTEDGRFRNLEVNPAFVASTGLARDDLIGKTIEETVPQAIADIVNAKYRRCVEGGEPLDEESILDLPTGRRFYSSTLIPLRDGNGRIDRLLGISRDVTARRLAEEALKSSQAKLALHIEQTLLGVIEWDTEFRVREWNPAAESIFGYSRAEALGRHAAELILPEAAREQVEPVWDQLMRQQGGQFNTNENVTKDGRTILCEWVNTPLVDDSGTVVGVMALARDVTERREAEELRIAKEAAEAASVAKSTFLANMSHEIRTPMNAILGFSQLMRHDKGLSERQRNQLDTINSSGEHLLALINDVLEMSKVEAGKVSVNPTAFDLHALLDEMESLFSQRAETKGLELRVVRSSTVPRFVVADENKLHQVLVNLLGNAVKFTVEGSVELRVRIQRGEDDGLRLFAEVEDTGCGIAPEDVGRLFRYFEQAGVDRQPETGTGLGLAISREFVRLLGGEITVESREDVGSVFRFDILVEEAMAAGGDVSEGRHVVGLQPGEPRYRVLIADDAPDNRELLFQLLDSVGFEVHSVGNGKAALEEFRDWHPQVILMDMRMPVLDGYEATRLIRATPTGAEVAIVGVTASAFAEMRQGVFDAGVNEFIVKPFHEGELFGKIGKLLGARYVYEGEAEETATEVTEPLGAEALAALPSELVSRLREAATSADFDTVLEVAVEVGRHDEPTASALRALAEQFDSESILGQLPGSEDS